MLDAAYATTPCHTTARSLRVLVATDPPQLGGVW